ncbi:hypothetical protein QL285_032985 [Trifolium repens]|jgi:hypothetical protein|nr:hypothetical protein QL285_032985 [Trifolium repens]
MQFLQNSWANLAEQGDNVNEDLGYNVLDKKFDLGGPTPVENQFELLNKDDSFKQVVSKKRNKKSTTSSSKAYDTRSKVGNLNLGQ